MIRFKKYVSLFLLATLLTSTIDFEAFANSAEECKEIIVKYKNDSELNNSKTKKSFNKNNNKKLQRKKLLHTKNTVFEVLEIANSDNAKEISKKLSKEPGVEIAVPNHKIKINPPKYNNVSENSLFNKQWGLYNIGQEINGLEGKKGIDINILNAWKITRGSPNVVVGVIDTGIDINHQDLKESIFVNRLEIPDNGVDDDGDGYVDDVNGWDFINHDNTVFDSKINDEHATHIAGIIAGENNNIGITGVASNVKILPLKIVDGISEGTVSDAIEAIEYAEKMGVSIINCSWAMEDYNELLELEMKNTDAVFICAAGNYSSDVSIIPVYPACFDIPNIISVASIDSNGQLDFMSNYGKPIDVAAPGVEIISTLPGNTYGFRDGTSMSTPFVSGIVALMKSQRNYSPQEIIKKLKAKVTKNANLKGKVKTSGIVNAYKSLR